jgi:hypothetical protein
MVDQDFGEMTLEWFDAAGAGKTATVPLVTVPSPVAAWATAVGTARPSASSREAALSPDVRKVLAALNEVLAGGRVSVEVTRAGEPARRAELDALLDAAAPWLAHRGK